MVYTLADWSMTRRFVLSVLLAVLVVFAGCSQLASSPNELGGTTTNANATVAATETTSRTPTQTTQRPASTATPTVMPTATAMATPTATSMTPVPTPTATATLTAIPMSTATQTPGPRFVVIIGGEPDDKVNYRMTVTGSIERRGKSYGAPIEDRHVTKDPKIDIISGSTVAGRVGGGGDAYRITGKITDFEATGNVTVYIDGERTDLG